MKFSITGDGFQLLVPDKVEQLISEAYDNLVDFGFKILLYVP